MDKYNVVLDEEKSKTAGSKQTCPKCGVVLPTEDGNVTPVMYCPNCGTEPWEKKPQSK